MHIMVYRFPEDAHTVAYGRTQHGTHGTRARAAPIDMAVSLLCFADLSFNNIEKIEGLEALTQITDLSLHHNQISTLEGLDSLSKLDVLSIGDNQLVDKETVRAPVHQCASGIACMQVLRWTLPCRTWRK